MSERGPPVPPQCRLSDKLRRNSMDFFEAAQHAVRHRQAMDGSHTLVLLSEHKPVLVQRFGLTRLALIDGVARGAASAGSDVDLLAGFDGLVGSVIRRARKSPPSIETVCTSITRPSSAHTGSGTSSQLMTSGPPWCWMTAAPIGSLITVA